jgi:bile acid:Na+ symporter, BASS family
MLRLRQASLALLAPALLVLTAGLVLGRPAWWQPALALATVAFAFGLGALPRLRGFQFTAWIVAAVAVPLLYPQAILQPKIVEGFSVNLRHPWAVLFIIQLVMFGMGTQMSLRDFAGVVKMPHGVVVGIFCQFTIMPLVGFSLARLLGFEPEIAAGLVLIGACSSGLASNVMAHMARLNLPLSITLTACATALAPFITPFWLTTLDTGVEREFRFVPAMLSIFKIVIAPIGAAMVHDLLKRADGRTRRVIWTVAALGALWLVALLLGGWTFLVTRWGPGAPLNLVTVAGYLLGAVLAGALYHEVARRRPGIDGAMPRFSMFGIVYFTAIATASGRNELLAIGLLLFVAAVAHNTIGYVLGYWLSRLLGLKVNDARTVALEVGMQNGGMAFGIASDLGKLATLGLAAAIFSPWMNISGSLLANYWHRRPCPESS